MDRDGKKRRGRPKEGEKSPNAKNGTNDDRQNDEEEEEDDDDRKPPAREVVVTRSPPNDSTDESSAASSVITPYAAPERLQLVSSYPSKIAPLPSALGMNSSTSLAFASPSHEEYQAQERIIRNRIYTLSGSALISMVYLLYVVLPLSALVSLAVAAASSALAANEMYRYSITEYQDRILHRGLGELLPDWLVQILTQRSLDDILMSMYNNTEPDPNPNLSRLLLLYFMPGLTVEQRRAFIERLPARHRQILQQPGGVGQLMGPTFMSLLVGQQRYENQINPALPQQDHHLHFIEEEGSLDRQISQEERRAIDRAIPSVNLRDHDDMSRSSLGVDNNSNRLAGGSNDQQAIAVVPNLRIQQPSVSSQLATHSNTSQRVVRSVEVERQEIDDDESTDGDDMQILAEAAMATMWTNYRQMTQSVTSAASSFAFQTAQQVARYGSRLALFAGGVGLIGFVATTVGNRESVVIGRNGLFNSMMRDFWAPPFGGTRTSVWSILFLGGGGAATVLYASNLVLEASSGNSKAKGGKKSRNGEKRR